ncbi:hypothetical protein CFC21_020895 [Triticum aestivum]|uniref:Uncharacterized protein n=2 Tax=Triticum aestivum TaxID=4565 RepID=A0A3B6BXH5_WHEAT|nr:hypothetical protein CFC21_020895 [Triticum aestivum]
MMKLAKVLHRKGFHITFVNTEYNQRRLIRSRGPDAIAGLPDFCFATILDDMPLSDADATQDPASLCYSTMTTCLPHLKYLLHDLNNKSATPLVRCVVTDGLMSLSVDAAADIGVPCVLFWTSSACGYMGYHSFWFLIDEGLTPLKDEEQVKNGYLDTPVAQARGMSKHMHLRDFSSFIRTTDPGDVMFNFLKHEVEQSDRAAAVILNTFDELEQTALDAMCSILPLPIYIISPLNFLTEQLATKGRCLLASWCEQEAVLRHEAVGAFLTHCGWNSMMEGISVGVPMLCWPFFAEQQTNSRYACVEWGVGMEVGDDVRREAVEARIREVMGGEGVGKEMRRKAAEWSEIAVRATTQPGGRSLANLESLFKDVLLIATENAE